ncbi:hypothetical protein MPAR168_06860 [Methylorubrum populi]|uniref:DUF308 domain-containing protein n=2 Tax=Methylobacteriaceae TaxID=119045 RepID=A0ABU7TFS8_9HYPH
MVVALLALSLVMILGGIAAVVQGFPYVRLESGLAMVIGGSTAASAGVILLGLTAVLDRLRKLGDSLDRRLDASPGQNVPQSVPAAPAFATPSFAAAPWEPEAPAASASAAAPEVVAPERPSLAAMGAGMGAAGLAGLSIGALRPGARGSEPLFEDPTPPTEAAAEPLLPDFLPDSAPAPAPERHTTLEAGAEEDLFAAPEPAPHAFPGPEPVALHEATEYGSEPEEAHPQETHPQVAHPQESHIEEATAPETIGLRSSLDEPAPEPAASDEAEPAASHAETTEAAPDPERHAVGSYASGANTYVMFSDGSIEADTPRGRFTFASLDELKSFVNAGGEETRGAA